MRALVHEADTEVYGGDSLPRRSESSDCLTQDASSASSRSEEADEEEDEENDVATPTVALSDAEFKLTLTQVIPQLRAFGRSLSGSRDLADDLVQETLMKAWEARARFQAGTNMRAWTFIILRNFYLSQMRRARFHGDWDDLVAERVLAAPSSQEKHVELGDLQRALMYLPTSQREALVLVGAGGFSYEEAAEICGVAVGTIKSRVARGRVALETLMSGTDLTARCKQPPNPGGDNAFDTIMGEVDHLSHRPTVQDPGV